MRFYFNKKGLSGISVSSGRSSGGCGTLIGVVFILYLIGHFSSPSDEDIKNESSSYKTAVVKSDKIISEICDQFSTDDSAKIFFNSNLNKHWYKTKVKVNSLSDQRLSAIDFKNPELKYEIRMSDSRPLKVGDIISVEFVPTEFSKYSCEISGTIGKYK
ncbi:TPA: hypothetical protein ACWKRV_005585 [Escherichia coli]|uniref:hypothetical protein n=2 Tax=Escherichia coli TaxID=562 RepID=UPI000A3B288B|nr:hypothetical protein [Escherichia coli]EAX7303303.1 hypothetical protein [Salmonella enterica]ECM1025933.1 hypothetical protein [Salmonella enterica subsp. enterica serovar Give]EDU9347330.1 hypothetical protein [Salmonella enterica subsp. enterica]EEP8235254.1 hypothetical protein [Salmonella enterica subsp. enterica serovar Chester]KAE9700049.1 hypothetical protein GP721_23255 [Enterobacteriaceae bacterium TzEc077]